MSLNEIFVFCFKFCESGWIWVRDGKMSDWFSNSAIYNCKYLFWLTKALHCNVLKLASAYYVYFMFSDFFLFYEIIMLTIMKIMFRYISRFLAKWLLVYFTFNQFFFYLRLFFFYLYHSIDVFHHTLLDIIFGSRRLDINSIFC